MVLATFRRTLSARALRPRPRALPTVSEATMADDTSPPSDDASANPSDARAALMAQINALQAEMQAKGLAMAEEEDVDVLIKTGEELQGLGQKLQALAEQLAGHIERPQGPSSMGAITIELTPPQRSYIHEQTGVEMDVLVVRDKSAYFNELMPNVHPFVVEQWALEEARRVKQAQELRVQQREQARAALAELEANDHPEFKAKLAELKADPTSAVYALVELAKDD